MATTPCADLPRNDTTFVAFLDAWATAADVWPKDWQESGLIYVDMFRRFGCHYLYMNSATDAEYGWEDTSVTLQPSYHSGRYTNPSYANFSNPDGSYTDPGILGPACSLPTTPGASRIPTATPAAFGRPTPRRGVAQGRAKG